MKADRWKEIERLYEASFSLPTEQRARFLAEHCYDSNVRREVESLLAQRENVPSLLEQRGLDVAAGIMSRNEPGTLVGRTIDHYEVRAFIGAGGMGAVYLAEDTQLEGQVALKVPHFDTQTRDQVLIPLPLPPGVQPEDLARSLGEQIHRVLALEL